MPELASSFWGKNSRNAVRADYPPSARNQHVSGTAYGGELLQKPHQPVSLSQSGLLGDGSYIRTYAMKGNANNFGIAVFRDGCRFAVSNIMTHTITVYSTEDGSEVCTFGGEGHGPGQFRNPFKICVTHRDTLLVADNNNERVQEVSATGEHIRFIGEGVFGGRVCGVDCNDEHIVATRTDAETGRIYVIDYSTGAVVVQFGVHGGGYGQIGYSSALRLTPDGRHIIVEDTLKNGRLCVFTVTGVFVRNVGGGKLGYSSGDLYVAVDGRIVVADICVSIFSANGDVLLNSWGRWGGGDGQFKRPCALAVHGDELFVLDHSGRVQVFH